jgi:hypothetical protein
MKKLGILIIVLVLGLAVFARDRLGGGTDVTVTDSNSVDLTLNGQDITADVNETWLSTQATDPNSHDAVTVTDTESIDLTLTGQDVEADVNETYLDTVYLDLATYDVGDDGNVDGNDTAFDIDDWDNDVNAPSKNAIRDMWASVDTDGDLSLADESWLTDLFLSAADSNEYIQDLVGAMLPSTLTYNDDANDITKIGFYKFNVLDPNGAYGIDTQIGIDPNLSYAITIVEVTVTCNADPDTELDWDLKFADALIGLANATLVVACDTTSGTADVDSGFNDATVPAGKTLYMEFGAQPDENITQALVKIKYEYD